MEEERFVSEVRAMERTLYRVARGYLRTWDECADAVQEALCKAWDKRKRVDESYFRPWLTRIVINECHNIGRRKKRLIPVAEPEREPAPEPAAVEESADAEQAPRIEKAAAARVPEAHNDDELAAPGEESTWPYWQGERKPSKEAWWRILGRGRKRDMEDDE